MRLSRIGAALGAAVVLLSFFGCKAAKQVGANAPYITADGYASEEILSYFSEIAFGSEFGSYRGTICKWDTEILLWISGDYAEEERAVIDNLMTRLNEIPDFPGIRYAETETEANFVFRFVLQGDLIDYFGANAENCSGMSRFSWRKAGGDIVCAEAGVASNITPQNAKKSVICEELLQSLGLASDSYSYPESVFYEGYNASTHPAEIDWALLSLLYHETILPGMSYGDAIEAASVLLDITDMQAKEEETMYG